MAAVNRVYAARLAGMVVLGPDGESIGRVRDVVISISIVRHQPRVLGLVVELLTRRRIFVPIGRVTAIDPSAVTLTTANVSLRKFSQRPGEVLVLEADHRRHAEVENAIRDLKYGVGLNHLPSGRFAANGAWLAACVIAHNLARWTSRIGLGQALVTTKTLRRRLFGVAGRLTRSARRWTLRLPDRWPWALHWSMALARFRAMPLLA